MLSKTDVVQGALELDAEFQGAAPPTPSRTTVWVCATCHYVLEADQPIGDALRGSGVSPERYVSVALGLTGAGRRLSAPAAEEPQFGAAVCACCDEVLGRMYWFAYGVWQ